MYDSDHLQQPIRCRLRRRRQGATYVLVMMTTAIVFTVSLAGITGLRLMRRTMQQRDHAREALWLAYSGMEHAAAVLEGSGDWRSEQPIDENTDWFRLGNGAFRWRLLDEDGDLADNDNDPVTVVSIGKVGDAIRTLRQVLEPTGQGIDALQSTVHCSGNLTIETTKVWEGRFTCNGVLTVPSGEVVSGNGQGVIVAGVGLSVAGALLNGTSMTLPSGIPMPSAEVFEQDYYRARATSIDFETARQNGGWNGKLLSRLHNPWGPANSEGIYYIIVPEDQKLELENCRICATLLIDLAEDSALQVLRNVVWEPPAGRYPAMIARTLGGEGAEIEIAGTGTLSESTWGVNFNPPGLPYRGMQNANQTDLLPATLRGLFHVIRQPGDTTQTVLSGDLPHKTCFLIEGNALVQGTSFASDTGIWQNAPPGYVAQPTMRPRAGSLNWIATEP